MATTKSMFKTLSEINVNDKTEGKNGLTYLSWTWAWAEFCKVYPDATYEIWKDENGLPYVFDPNTGYMCYTSVTVGDLTHEMWLPVMDSANNAMKAVPYSYKTKYGKEVRVAAATMFDINKTIMRCLTKCLAMFGLGLYIYAGEDLPDDLSATEEEMAEKKKAEEKKKKAEEKAAAEKKKAEEKEAEPLRAEVQKLLAATGIKMEQVLDISKFDRFEDFDIPELKGCISWLKSQKGA